ncbi:MAG: hypothetical protein M1813_005690 [Trichoglossum hirsutum]|nr:MAG: hypothetical protein M1813_005690 [Trichoglossum hirsutum]
MSDVLPTSNGTSNGSSFGVLGHFRTLSVSSRRQRRPTFPLAHSTRRKPRRWPLALRFIKGAIHTQIIVPVVLHALFTLLIVYLDRGLMNVGLPSSIIPSLSIVVGLMLVFRNGTSYERWWTGRSHLTTISTSVRNLTRSFLCCSYKSGETPTPAEKAETESVVRILIAILYSVKNHLRAEWGVAIQPGTALGQHGIPTQQSEYSELLPVGLKSGETDGLGLPLELTFFVEKYIRKGLDKGWFHPPQASQMQMQLNTLVDAYGRMETIKLTPIPVAHLIHQKQVLALFGCILPFAMVDEMGWWAVPIVCIVTFTLYGIEGIGSQLEDPFGYDKNDIKMDAIVQDSRQEIMVMLEEWKKGGEMFLTHSAAVLQSP